jgi:hypothetical protein
MGENVSYSSYLSQKEHSFIEKMMYDSLLVAKGSRQKMAEV